MAITGGCLCGAVREIFIDNKPASYALVGAHERWTEAETFARLTPPDAT